MEKEEDDFGYSDNVCAILEKLRINSTNLHKYHQQRFHHFKSYSKWFRLPIILLSVVSASAAVGLENLDIVEQRVISGITCIISLLIAMLSAVEMHLNIHDKIEDAIKFSKAFYSLSTDIYMTLRLQPSERAVRGGDYLGKVFSDYTKMVESSEVMRRGLKYDMLCKVPKEYAEYKFSPTTTPEPSVEDENVAYRHFPHSSSVTYFHPSPRKDISLSLDDILTEKDIEENVIEETKDEV